MTNRIIQFDGLRALAFLIVILHHSGAWRPGWMGVDVFFVLSGFLITSILRKRRTEAHPLKHFYANRVRRILPPYLICLAFNAIFFAVDWRHVGVYYVLPLENIASLSHWTIGGLSHLWSLAIEEQFYLLWPLLVIGLPRGTLLYVLSAIVIISPVLRMVATPFCPSIWTTYMLTPFRLDTISMGALLALLYESPEASDWLKKYSSPIFFAAVTMLAFASHFGIQREGNSVLFNSIGYSLVAVMSAGLVVWSTIGKGWLYTLLTIRPLRYIGKISYMGYLIHLPMILLLQTLGSAHGIYNGRRLALVSLPLTLLFASITWYLIEQPILHWRKSPTNVAVPPSVLQTQASGPASFD